MDHGSEAFQAASDGFYAISEGDLDAMEEALDDMESLNGTMPNRMTAYEPVAAECRDADDAPGERRRHQVRHLRPAWACVCGRTGGADTDQAAHEDRCRPSLEYGSEPLRRAHRRPAGGVAVPPVLLPPRSPSFVSLFFALLPPPPPPPPLPPLPRGAPPWRGACRHQGEVTARHASPAWRSRGGSRGPGPPIRSAGPRLDASCGCTRGRGGRRSHRRRWSLTGPSRLLDGGVV
jgi:hypothetical protein